MELDITKNDLNFIIKLLLKESAKNDSDHEQIVDILYKLQKDC